MMQFLYTDCFISLCTKFYHAHFLVYFSLLMSSVSKAFQGDYVRLRTNAKYSKTYSTTNDQHVVFADVISKINRGNGKVCPHMICYVVCCG